MKKLIAVSMLFIFAIACSPSSESVQDIVDIAQIEMYQQNNVEKALLEEYHLITYVNSTAEFEAGTYIFNAYESYQVEEDGIMYLYEAPLLGGGASAIPCTQTIYDNAIGKEEIFETSFDLISYYKKGKDGVIYHKEVFYKDVSKKTIKQNDIISQVLGNSIPIKGKK